MMSVLRISVLFAALSTISVAGLTYRLEGLFAVDYQLLKSYYRETNGNSSSDTRWAKAKQELREDVDYILNELNNLFQNFHPEFSIEIYSQYINPLNFNFRRLPGTVNGVDNDELFYTFDNYLETKGLRQRYQYDFALLWTGHDIYDRQGTLYSGGTTVGSICRPEQASAIVTFDKTYLTALRTVHQIGHLLGSWHRNPASQNIMTQEWLKTVKKRWYFSNSTTADIKEYLESLTDNCLLKNSGGFTKVTKDYNSYKGRMLDVDVICRRQTNFNVSFLIRHFYGPDGPRGDSLCQHLYCALPGYHENDTGVASDGTLCDVGKRCKKGKCMDDSTAPIDIDSDCLTGDQPYLIISYGKHDCAEFLNTTGPNICNTDWARNTCCASCKALGYRNTDNTFPEDIDQRSA